jgi:hypothetical protein
MGPMESAFAIVLFVVVGVAAVAAVWALVTSGGSYDQIGGGRMSLDRQATPAEREAEIRQMLEAKAYRQRARGETPLDVEAELSKLLADQPSMTPGADAGLAEEVRQLVVARNERRIRQGKEPLDVDEEVNRQLRELENLGQ